MNEIKKLWDELKSMLHHGPSMQPLWQAMIDQMHSVEARLVALEAGLKDRIAALIADAEGLFHDNMGKAMEAELKSLVAGFEAHIAALEAHPAVSIPPLAPVEQAKPVEDVKPVEDAKPTEQVIQPDATLHDEAIELEKEITDQPAAASANDSSAAGDNAGPNSPTAQPELVGAGPKTDGQPEQSGKGEGEHHGD